MDKHLPKKVVKKDILKWYQKPILPEQFISKQDKTGKIYGHHEAWKNTLWIGPYDTEEELGKVIAQYVSNSKREPMKKKEIKNLHSIIMTEKDWQF